MAGQGERWYDKGSNKESQMICPLDDQQCKMPRG